MGNSKRNNGRVNGAVNGFVKEGTVYVPDSSILRVPGNRLLASLINIQTDSLNHEGHEDETLIQDGATLEEEEEEEGRASKDI